MRHLETVELGRMKHRIYGHRLTPHDRIGELVLIVNAYQLPIEEDDGQDRGRNVARAEVVLAAPNYFADWDRYEAMFAHRPDPDDVYDRALACARFQAVAPLALHEWESLDPLPGLLEEVERDTVFYDATVLETLNDHAALFRMKTGEEVGV